MTIPAQSLNRRSSTVDIAANAVRTWRIVSRIATHRVPVGLDHGSASALEPGYIRFLRAVQTTHSSPSTVMPVGHSSSGKSPAKGVAGHVAGQANILIFPNIDSCNIGYKIVEHLGGALTAPVTQGFARSYHDVSRGASPNDLAATCLFAALIGAVDSAARSGS
jgi:hypothetical protein